MRLIEEKEEEIDWRDVSNLDYNARSLSNLTYKKVSSELKQAIIKANQAVVDAYLIYNKEILEPRKARERQEKQDRLAKTATQVQLTQAQAELIDSVLGQMSDDYWENNKAYDVYWENMSLNNNVLTVDINKMEYALPYQKRGELVALFKDPSQIKKWFARKAQIIQNSDKKDNNGDESSPSNYLDSDLNKTIGDVQRTIDSLR